MRRACAGLVGREPGLVELTHILTGSIRKIPLLPAETSFVEQGAGKEICVPLGAIEARRNCAVSESVVEIGHLRRTGAVVVLFDVGLVDQAHVDALCHCEVVGLP